MIPAPAVPDGNSNSAAEDKKKVYIFSKNGVIPITPFFFGLGKAGGGAAAQKRKWCSGYMVEIAGNYLSCREISSIIICVTDVLP